MSRRIARVGTRLAHKISSLKWNYSIVLTKERKKESATTTNSGKECLPLAFWNTNTGMEREKPPSVGHSPTTTTVISKDLSSEVVSQITGFFNRRGISENIPHNYTTKDSHSDFIRGLFVKIDLVQRGRISCLLSVKPAVTVNYYSFPLLLLSFLLLLNLI